MFRKLLKLAGLLVLIVLALVVAGVTYLYFSTTRAVHGKAPETPSVLRYAEDPPAAAVALIEAAPFDFNPAQFAQPSREFGPMTRWWWPGADVDQVEIDRELEKFAANGFAGVEIQPFTMGLNPEAEAAERARVMSWDTEAFYETLRKTLESAASRELIVDLNNGSGWPTGGPHIALEDNFRTLLFRETTVSGGQEVSWELEPPDPPLSAYVSLAMLGTLGGDGNGVHFPEAAELVAITAVRIVRDERSRWPWSVSDQVVLDPASAVDITASANGDTLTWTAPEGEWRLISFWSLPDGEQPAVLAKTPRGFVVDHFDAAKVRANYDYLFGGRTGLAPYFGKPLRAVFNDSYEFKAERHFTSSFFEEFERRRGYDIRPWLPAVVKPGYNHLLGHIAYAHSKPDFVFSDEDSRLRYDYDLTLSELLIAGFLETSADWMSRRGLQHRTQAYGMPMDVIAASGAAHIPETEQLFWGGSEAFLKGVASGAWLYNRPVVTAEAVVYMSRAYTSTPQKIKLSVDKAFTSGVNQIIYHGTAYRYQTADFGEIGWYPWSSPYVPFLGFSTDLRESNPFWKFVPQLNEYIARAQYALRSGRPSVDVLLYYPFLGFLMNEEELNPEELLPRGEFVGVESSPAPMRLPFAASRAEREKSPTQAWLAQVWEITNTLEELGITWGWVNDESLQQAAFENGAWRIRGNEFQALVLAHIPFMQVETAESIRSLADAGAAVAIVGEAPNRQPSFRDYEARDRAVAQAFHDGIKGLRLADARGLQVWSDALSRPIRYAAPYRHLRQIRRVMSDGGRIAFLRSQAKEWTEIRVELDPGMRSAVWMNPEDGSIRTITDATYALPPYGSVIVYTTPTATRLEISSAPKLGAQGTVVAVLEGWSLRAHDVERPNAKLGDWRDDAELRYAGEGAYSTRFELPEIHPASRYVLDLGTVSATAEVRVNGGRLQPSSMRRTCSILPTG